MDRKDPTYRHELFPEYKAHRSPPDDEFLVQLPEFRRLMTAFNIPLFELSGYESDDLLGTIARSCSEQSLTTYIMSGDLDLLQLITDSTFIITNKKGNAYICDAEAVKERYALLPNQIDYKALKGDASDNIPGVKGVGDKTAVKLLLAYQSLDGVYDHIADISSKSLALKVETHKDMAYLSKQLVAIDCHANGVFIGGYAIFADWSLVHREFEHYNFKRLMSRIPLPNDSNSESSAPLFIETSMSIIESHEQMDHLVPLLKKERFAFDLETTSLDPQDAQIVAISITASSGISLLLTVACHRREPIYLICPAIAIVIHCLNR